MRWLRRQPEPDSQPAPDVEAVASAQREADALRKTAQELGETNPDDAKYW